MNSKKTVVHFSQDFTKGKPQLGGFSRIYNSCLDNNDHIIYTISSQIGEIEEYVIGDIRVVQIPVNKRPSGVFNQIRLYRPIAKLLLSHLEENNIVPDLFFGHSHQGNFLILNYVRKRISGDIKILWEANGIGGMPRVNRPLKQLLANRVQYYLQKYVFNKCELIIAQTQMSREFITKEFGITKDKIEVVPNAIHTQNRPEIKKTKLKRPIKILCFGLFDKLNGIPFLLKVIKENSLDDLSFHFAGSGKYLKEVKSMAESYQNITYLGQLSHEEMLLKLKHFDFFIIPRIQTLGAQLFIPTKLLEGMFYGVVPICSKLEGITVVVENETNGFIFETEDEGSLMSTLQKLNNISYDDYISLSENAQETVTENYDWNSNHLMLNEIYDRLL